MATRFLVGLFVSFEVEVLVGQWRLDGLATCYFRRLERRDEGGEPAD